MSASVPAQTGTKQKILPPFVLPVVVVCYVLFGFGENAVVALFSIVSLLLGCALLWRPGETPILLFVFGNQWVQASIASFYGNWRGVNIDRLTLLGDATSATVLSLIGLLFLAAGMRLAAGRGHFTQVKLAQRTAREQSQLRFFWLYGIAFAVAVVARSVAVYAPGLQQPLLALSDLRWAAFFMFSFVTFVRGDSNRALWFAAFMIEFATSLGGYFSSFKFVFLFTLLAFLAAQIRLSPKKAIIGIVGAVVLLTFGIIWTAVKGDYRSFVNGGSQSQFVAVDYGESVQKLIDLTTDLDSQKLSDAVENLITRVATVDFFGVVLTYVPRIVPHEDGAIWFDAISRPFMPRLLFPNKETIDASIITNKYTGIDVAGTEQGTSISIGYMAESYVDFGTFGMMVPIFLFGLVLGGVYRWLMLHRNSHGIVGMGLSTAILLPNASDLGNSATSMFGAVVVAVLVAWLLIVHVAPILLPPRRTRFSPNL